MEEQKQEQSEHQQPTSGLILPLDHNETDYSTDMHTGTSIVLLEEKAKARLAAEGRAAANHRLYLQEDQLRKRCCLRTFRAWADRLKGAAANAIPDGDKPSRHRCSCGMPWQFTVSGGLVCGKDGMGQPWVARPRPFQVLARKLYITPAALDFFDPLPQLQTESRDFSVRCVLQGKRFSTPIKMRVFRIE
jgi:hypothetical protein